jgi:anti-anti-sigma factor
MKHDEALTLVTTAVADDPTAGPHAYRLVAQGEIDLETAEDLANALDSLIAEGAQLVILDASEVKFLDSSGLRVIVNCSNKLSTAGGRLLIEGMSGAVQRVLEVSGLLSRYKS